MRDSNFISRVRGKGKQDERATRAMDSRSISTCRRSRASRPLRTSVMSDSCFREKVRAVFVLHPKHRLFDSEIASRVQSPNKAPEPTLGLARSSQGSVVFDLVTGVAHLRR